MKKPSPEVIAGLRVLRPVIAALLESELQEYSEADLECARRTLAWIDDLLLLADYKE